MSRTDHSQAQGLDARTLQALGDLAQRGMFVVEVHISPVSAANGSAVASLQLPIDCVLIAVMRGEALIFPHGDTVFETWDRVFAVVRAEAEDAFREALTSFRD